MARLSVTTRVIVALPPASTSTRLCGIIQVATNSPNVLKLQTGPRDVLADSACGAKSHIRKRPLKGFQYSNTTGNQRFAQWQSSISQ